MIQLGDIVEVITHEWDGYGLRGRIAIVAPPREPDSIFAFELLFKPAEWKYEYFHLGPEGMKRISEFVRVLGHV